jgi:hypothetical protein
MGVRFESHRKEIGERRAIVNVHGFFNCRAMDTSPASADAGIPHPGGYDVPSGGISAGLSPHPRRTCRASA